MLAATRSLVNYSLLNKVLHGVSTVEQAFIPLWYTIRNESPSILATSVLWRFSLVAFGCCTWSMVETGKKLWHTLFFTHQLSNILISSTMPQRHILPSVNVVESNPHGGHWPYGIIKRVSAASWYPFLLFISLFPYNYWVPFSVQFSIPNKNSSLLLFYVYTQDNFIGIIETQESNNVPTNTICVWLVLRLVCH